MTRAQKSIAIVMLVLAIVAIFVLLTPVSSPALAEESGSSVEESAENNGSEKTAKAIAAAAVVGVVAAAGALAMALSIAKSNESTARQPEAGGQIRTSLMLGLVFIETAIIYALIVAILIIFVL